MDIQLLEARVYSCVSSLIVELLSWETTEYVTDGKLSNIDNGDI